MDNCFFCTIQFQTERIIWSSSTLTSIYDEYPVNPGHTVIIPKRHIANVYELDNVEWKELRQGIEEIIKVNLTKDFVKVYNDIINIQRSQESIWFCKQALNNPRINTKPDAYNHGVNDGRAAGRTVDHVHWHIIPRFNGDMDDPRGGVRYVIPSLGNYKTPRD